MTKLLIVDNNPQSLYLLQVLLSTNGFELELASNGAEALERSRRAPPDMIISDILMPVMDGFALCRACKQDERLRDIPFIFYTATYTDPKDEEFALSLGAERFIVKPVEPDKFLALLRETIETHAAGKLVVPREPITEEAEYYEQYNAALIRKLEDKALQLEATNRALELDIAERKRAEEALWKAGERYRGLFEGVPVGLFRSTLDGQILDANPALIEMLGYPDWKSLVAGDAADLFVNPEDREKQQVLLEREGILRHFEMQLRRYDGALIWVRSTVRAARDAEGRVTYCEGSLEDITERKRAEEELRKLSRAVDQSPASVVITDPAGDIEYVNPKFTEITGYTAAEVMGKNPRILKSGETPAEKYKRLWETITSGGIWRGEFHNKKKTGKLYWELASISPVFDMQGKITHFVAVKEDITERKQGEEALRASEQRFRSVVEQSADSIVMADEQGNVIEWNPAYEQLTGLTGTQVLGRPIWDVLFQVVAEEKTPAVRDRFRASTLEFLRTGQAPWLNQVLETEVQRPDGTRRIAQGVMFPIKTDKGFMSGGITRDITERKQTEKALHESEERFRQIFDNMSSGAVVYEATRDGEDFILKDFNRAAERIERVSKQDVIGKSVLEVFPGIKDEGFGLFEAFRRVWRTGKPEHHPVSFYQDQRVSGWKENYICKLPSGEIVAIYDDVTVRKWAEEALRKSEERYRGLVETSPDAIVLTDLNDRVFLWNQRVIAFGLEGVEGMLGKNLLEFIVPKDRARAIDLRRKLLETGAPGSIECALLRKDGDCFPAEVSGTLIRNPDGIPQALVVVMRDITERKRVEETLAQERLLLRTVIDNLPDAVYAKDRRGRKILANRADLNNIGRPEAEVLGKTDAELFPPQVAVRFQADDQTVLCNGQPVLNREEQLINHEGKQIRQLTSKLPLKDAAGQIVGLVGIGHDITERKQMEEALRESEERFRLAAQSTSDLIYEWSIVNGRLEWFGDIDRLLGYAQGGFPRTIEMWEKAIHPDDRDRVMAAIERHLKTQAPFVEEYRIRRKEGTFLHLTDCGTALRDKQGDPYKWIGACTDVTQRKQVEEGIQRHIQHLATLREIDQALTSTLDLDQVLSTLLEQTCNALNADAASVALVEAGTDALVFRQAVGGAGQTMIGLRLEAGQGIAGWVTTQRQTALVPHAASDPRFYENVDASTGFTTRDLMCTPLIVRDAVVGVLELVNKHTGQFSEDDVGLLESVAAQAAIAIENARLFETERSARQRLETLYSLGQVINSTLDAAAILDRLTDEAMQVTHATHGSAMIALTDLARFDRRSLRGYSPEQAERARRIFLPLDQGLNGRAYRARQTVYLPDVQSDPDYFALIPETRSELVVPILRSGQVLANLDLQSPQPDAFHDVDWKLLSALIDQVAMALENARLFEETHRHLDEISIVSQVALIGAAGRPFDETVSRAAGGMSRLWSDSHVSFLFLDETDQVLRLHPASWGTSPGLAADFHIPIGQGLMGWAARERQPVRVNDVMLDPRDVVGTPGMRSKMVAPLLVGEHTIGVINVEHPWPNAYSGDDLRVLATLAGELATIFEKARLDAALEAERASLARRVEERTVELRVANEQLRQAHEEVSRALEKEKELGELKSRFISTTSHEFRTPLSTILSSSELLEHYGNHWTEDKRLQHLRRIQTAVGNMVQLLDDVLIIGRAEAGRLEFKPAPLDVVQFCGDLMEELRLGIGAHHAITFSRRGECAEAHMDERLLRQILSNVLSNAIKYSPQGSPVYFELECREGQVVFRVQDQGIGIPPEDQPRLFESFHRAGNVGNIPGTGLGLTIVKKSVDLHSGTISVDSRVGEGTTFVVTLPSYPPAKEENT